VSEVAGLIIVVQSSTYSSYHVEKQIQLFLEHFYDNVLKKMQESQLKDYLEALKSEKLEPARRLSEQAAWFWSEISSYSYYFNRLYEEAVCLDQISTNNVLKYFQRYFFSGEQRRLTIHLKKDKALEDNSIYRSVFQDALTFKRNQFIYPTKQFSMS
jgi:secreted Zn-dependent insulinase-like peptidase